MICEKCRAEEKLPEPRVYYLIAGRYFESRKDAVMWCTNRLFVAADESDIIKVREADE